jgi:isopentenyldiphosphate isomerase
MQCDREQLFIGDDEMETIGWIRANKLFELVLGERWLCPWCAHPDNPPKEPASVQ